MPGGVEPELIIVMRLWRWPCQRRDDAKDGRAAAHSLQGVCSTWRGLIYLNFASQTNDSAPDPGASHREALELNAGSSPRRTRALPLGRCRRERGFSPAPCGGRVSLVARVY